MRCHCTCMSIFVEATKEMYSFHVLIGTKHITVSDRCGKNIYLLSVSDRIYQYELLLWPVEIAHLSTWVCEC